MGLFSGNEYGEGSSPKECKRDFEGEITRSKAIVTAIENLLAAFYQFFEVNDRYPSGTVTAYIGELEISYRARLRNLENLIKAYENSK